MRVGTKSILFGAHQFALHPLMVAIAWWKLYGFPWRWQLWLAFVVHDIGYWGAGDMDGAEGMRHPERGARVMMFVTRDFAWWAFSLFHSRRYAKENCATPSRLCHADKYAFVLTPRWLYLPMARASGELREYMAETGHTDERKWHAYTKAHLRQSVRNAIGRFV